jgi:hypothetical protein
MMLGQVRTHSQMPLMLVLPRFALPLRSALEIAPSLSLSGR